MTLRDGALDALGDIDEGAARPHRGVERGKLVVPGRDRGPKVFLEDFGVFLEAGVGVEEDHALLFQVLADLVVDHFGFILGGHAIDQALAFRLGDAQAVIGLLDVLGQVVPRLGYLVGGTNKVLEVVEIQEAEVWAPGGDGFALEGFECLEADVQHPLRFVLGLGDIADYLFIQALFRGLTGVV